jgi:hypothetical protein
MPLWAGTDAERVVPSVTWLGAVSVATGTGKTGIVTRAFMVEPAGFVTVNV